LCGGDGLRAKWKEAPFTKASLEAMKCYVCVRVEQEGDDAYHIAAFAAPDASDVMVPMHVGDVPFPLSVPLYPESDVVMAKLKFKDGPHARAPFVLGTPGDGPWVRMDRLSLTEWKTVVVPALKALDAQTCLAQVFGQQVWTLKRRRRPSREDAGAGTDTDTRQDQESGDDLDMDLDADADADADADEEEGRDGAAERNDGDERDAMYAGQDMSEDMDEPEDSDEEEVVRDEDDAVIDTRTGLVVDKLGHDVGDEDEMESIEGSEEEEVTDEEDVSGEEDDPANGDD
jgi:hypothetical protein